MLLKSKNMQVFDQYSLEVPVEDMTLYVTHFQQGLRHDRRHRPSPNVSALQCRRGFRMDGQS